jgi:acyl-coenzyme A thioesterase PaaI-like protein
MARVKKKERQKLLLQEVKEKPFLTDEELARDLDVSVQTIRLDRLELGIPELRGRIRKMAETAQRRIKSIKSGEVVGELIDLELGHSGISLLRITDDMVFSKSKIAKGNYMFSQANSLATAVIDAPMAVTGIANVKYKVPVHVGEKLIAKAEIVRRRGNKYFVWVKTRNDREEVFRAKFIMVSLEEEDEQKKLGGHA